MNNKRLFSNVEIYNVLVHQKAEIKKEIYAVIVSDDASVRRAVSVGLQIGVVVALD